MTRPRPDPDPTDESLVQRVVEGCSAALGILYDRYGRSAFALARRICVDDGIAQDVVQEAFLAFWGDPGRFAPQRGTFRTWLMTLVHHKSVDAVRRESTFRRRTGGAEHGDDRSVLPGPGPDQAALDVVLAAQVRAALDALPAEQREALMLAYYGGYTLGQVAALTGVPLGTVKSRTFAALARLRDTLDPLTSEFSSEITGRTP